MYRSNKTLTHTNLNKLQTVWLVWINNHQTSLFPLAPVFSHFCFLCHSPFPWPPLCTPPCHYLASHCLKCWEKMVWQITRSTLNLPCPSRHPSLLLKTCLTPWQKHFTTTIPCNPISAYSSCLTLCHLCTYFEKLLENIQASSTNHPCTSQQVYSPSVFHWACYKDTLISHQYSFNMFIWFIMFFSHLHMCKKKQICRFVLVEYKRRAAAAAFSLFHLSASRRSLFMTFLV